MARKGVAIRDGKAVLKKHEHQFPEALGKTRDVASGLRSAAKRAGTSTSAIKEIEVQGVGRAADVAAMAVGMSPATYIRARVVVVAAAESDPEKFGGQPQLQS